MLVPVIAPVEVDERRLESVQQLADGKALATAVEERQPSSDSSSTAAADALLMLWQRSRTSRPGAPARSISLQVNEPPSLDRTRSWWTIREGRRVKGGMLLREVRHAFWILFWQRCRFLGNLRADGEVLLQVPELREHEIRSVGPVCTQGDRDSSGSRRLRRVEQEEPLQSVAHRHDLFVLRDRGRHERIPLGLQQVMLQVVVDLAGVAGGRRYRLATADISLIRNRIVDDILPTSCVIREWGKQV